MSGKLDPEDRQRLEAAVKETIEWLDANQVLHGGLGARGWGLGAGG